MKLSYSDYLVGRGLADEIQAAARCSEILAQSGLHIAFKLAKHRHKGQALDIELRTSGGQKLRGLPVTELFELVSLDAGSLAEFVGRARREESSSTLIA